MIQTKESRFVWDVKDLEVVGSGLAKSLALMDLQLDLIKVERDIAKAFDPSEARDSHGRWSTEVGGTPPKRKSRYVSVGERFTQTYQRPTWPNIVWNDTTTTAQISGDGESKRLILKSILALPKSELEQIKGLAIENVETLTAIINGQPTEVAGLAHQQSPPKVQIAQYVRGNPLRDIEGTSIHEVGHIRDYHMGFLATNPTKKLNFKNLIDDDANRMDSQQRDYAKYYFSNEKERFAELYRTAFGKFGTHAFGMDKTYARLVFANSIKKLYERVGISPADFDPVEYVK